MRITLLHEISCLFRFLECCDFPLPFWVKVFTLTGPGRIA